MPRYAPALPTVFLRAIAYRSAGTPAISNLSNIRVSRSVEEQFMIRCRAVIWAIAVSCSAALQATAMRGANAAEEVVYVNVIGGDWADSTIKAYFDAFQKETGIKPIA